MSVDLSKKRVILIHGLASKPPDEDLSALWRKSIVENIRVDDAELALELDSRDDVFSSAYWANATPHHIEDDQDYVSKLKGQVEAVIEERKEIGDGFHVGVRDKVEAFFKTRGADLLSLLGGALKVNDDVIKAFLRETELYDEDQHVADRMRQPLEEALRAAWTDNCDVALLSHSMGTFIAYDVLWRFSHRTVPGFKEFADKRVQMFATLGSPLGDSAVRGLLFARHHKSNGIRQYPTNVDFWHNYACLGDVVSHQHNFDEAFFKPMRELGIFPEAPRYRAIDYTQLHNPFKVVEHDGNKDREKRNPHKSFGYLVQPRLGTWLRDFMRGDLELQ